MTNDILSLQVISVLLWCEHIVMRSQPWDEYGDQDHTVWCVYVSCKQMCTSHHGSFVLFLRASYAPLYLFRRIFHLLVPVLI